MHSMQVAQFYKQHIRLFSYICIPYCFPTFGFLFTWETSQTLFSLALQIVCHVLDNTLMRQTHSVDILIRPMGLVRRRRRENWQINSQTFFGPLGIIRESKKKNDKSLFNLHIGDIMYLVSFLIFLLDLSSWIPSTPTSSSWDFKNGKLYWEVI